MQLLPLANVCRSCRHIAFRRRSTAQRSLRHASNANLPFTEKLRRKIWGTDNPPGLKDPYGGPSFLERRRMEREKKMKGVEEEDAEARERYDDDAVEAQSQLEAEAEEHALASQSYERPEMEAEEYTPAETWDGLEHLGHTGDWRDIEPTEADHFTPFLIPAGHTAPRQLLSSLHLAAVEVLALSTPITDKSFLDLPLDPSARSTFALIRRITELTGERIPDPVLSRAKTLRAIYIYQLESLKPKPKNLAEVLVNRKDLVGLGNVKILDRRQTPVHREKEVGRWKVIEQELRSRGLPVLGTQEA